MAGGEEDWRRSGEFYIYVVHEGKTVR